MFGQFFRHAAAFLGGALTMAAVPLGSADARQAEEFQLAGSLSDIAKKYNGGGDQERHLSDPDPERVIAVRGAWSLRYDIFWNNIDKRKNAVCVAYATASDTHGRSESSYIFYTRWETYPDSAEFSVVWGPTVDEESTAVLIVRGGNRKDLKLTQGFAFLGDRSDESVADVFSSGGDARLEFIAEENVQAGPIVQKFGLAGFDEIYRLLFSDCEPTKDFGRSQ